MELDYRLLTLGGRCFCLDDGSNLQVEVNNRLSKVTIYRGLMVRVYNVDPTLSMRDKAKQGIKDFFTEMELKAD